MTMQHKYVPVEHDGRSESEIWKLIIQRKFVAACLMIVLLPVISVRLLSSRSTSISDSEDPSPAEAQNLTRLIDFSEGGCNIWKGDWIPDPSEPPYTNATCRFIQDHQNCMKNGRPDNGYLHWRWKPHDCDLPLFDSKAYLTIVTNKSWAFIGDSIARNHFQSFLCLLAQVEVPRNLYRDDKDRFVHWYFPSYNFTLAVLWSPFLVEGTEEESRGFAKGIEKLYLDSVDASWARSVNKYDYIVLSSGQWFLKASVYFIKDQLIGCHYCPGTSIGEVGFYYAYRKALRTTFDFLLSSQFTGVAFFRTFTPDHFENGRWDNGGNCLRTMPIKSDAAVLQGMNAEMYKIQLEEFGRTLLKGALNMTFKLKLVDTIHASLVRPDAHPGPYRIFHPFAHDKHAQIQNDCLHWCLPGAIDAWSAMLLETLRHAA